MGAVNVKRCEVRYRRSSCTPFELGIEGARCMLDAEHAGEHVVQVLKVFGATPDEDVYELFRFQELV